VPIALQCALRTGENKANKNQAALKDSYIAIPAKKVAKAHPIIVQLVDAPEVEQAGT